MSEQHAPVVLRVSLAEHEGAAQRLDQYVADQIEVISRTRARGLILEGSVRVGGRLARPSYRVQAGDDVRVDLPPPVPSDLIPEEMSLSIAYEDEDMLVVDKPAGIAVHPAPGHAAHTIVHALLARYPNLPGIGGTQRPGIVHRLDLDTSGLLMVAKSELGMASLAAQFESRSIKKGYVALVKGRMATKEGVIDAPIGRDPAQRQRMAVVRGGREARTSYRDLAAMGDFALLLARPETGRTHQIRVHFSAVGAPVAGDSVYGGGVDFLRRQFLHATFLRFTRPRRDEPVELCSALPDDLIEALRVILRSRGSGAAEVDRTIAQMLGLAQKHYRNELLVKRPA